MYSLIRRLLFQLDAESAHEFTVAQMVRLQEIPLALSLIARLCRPRHDYRQLWGLTFATPIGIAAGFDKNALLMPFLAALGFGFLEVGTVTLNAQPGNPKPRVFRDPEHLALINRLGFNNDGADAVAQRLQRWREKATDPPPLFVNIGKNRDVPLDAAPNAYAQCYLRVGRWAEGAVLNLSSPNTPGLRELQRPEHLVKVLELVRAVREEMPFARPILVKISPDLDPELLAEVCDVCGKLADGMVCTNTTVIPEGGLSGKPLFGRSTDVLREVRECVGPNYPLIGVGGIFDANDARAKLAAGANLLQVYTGFVYEGPGLPSRLARELVV
ncbi:MAG TPA: quinone-dependent dihydroorotate dehydrogenase [Thermoanaerobaculia bacterium]|nr:quinone-dependent dihydroorotate dehydrogenase [Thermoanaerobaculia bacterium]